MAKRDREESEDTGSTDTLVLSKLLIKELNRDAKEKVAWNLATDDDDPTSVKDFVSTGSTLLDYIICNRRGGGVPVGKLTEICGEEATGKSLLATHILANTQRKGGLAILIDTENALNPDFARRVGLDLNQLVYLQPGTIEEVGETIEKVINMARAKDVRKVVTIVWDSVAGTPTKSEIEGSYDPNDRVGVTAKALAKMMRKITQTLGKDKITLVFTNQLKTKFGVMFGDPMGTPGGKAIPYHASVRVRLTRSTELKDEDKETFAVHTRAKVIKGRLGPSMRKCEFDIHFSHGVDDETSIRDYLHAVGEIEKRAGWQYMKFDGREVKFRADEFKPKMQSDPDFREQVMQVLDRHLIVKYDAKSIPDQELDPESLMDAEAVLNVAVNG